jgi:hypothetical protein
VRLMGTEHFAGRKWCDVAAGTENSPAHPDQVAIACVVAGHTQRIPGEDDDLGAAAECPETNAVRHYVAA